MNTTTATRPIPHLTEKDKARFWAKVQKRGETECWEWLGYRSPTGYGRFFVGPCDGKTRGRRAHRVAWAATFGELSTDVQVLHRCDTPACCNPRHLFTGTHFDNMQDMGAKGRSFLQRNPGFNRGEKHPSAKLDREKILAIRREFSQGTMQKDLAKKFCLSKITVHRVVHRKIWTHIE